MNALLIIGAILGNVILALFAFHKVKVLLVAGSVTLQRETGLGDENAHLTMNYYVWEDHQKVLERLMFLGEVSQERKEFTFGRAKRVVEDAENEQKVRKLNEAKG